MRAGGQGSQRAGRRLPVPLNRFIGREEELATLTTLIEDSDVRLVAITGPGGVGKTRLAVQAALAMEASFDGQVAIIRLAHVQDPADVLPALARAIGADDQRRSPRDALVEALADDRWLLVVDNFEHVLAAAPELAEVLRFVPGTTAVVTTRARLQVGGEHLVPLSPLPVPPLDLQSPVNLDQFAATRLFLDRALAAGTRFPLTAAGEAIAAICRRLDGLPLAIELAAARAAVLPPAALLEQLTAESFALSVLRGGPRDEPARLQSVAAAIAWSYDLLQPAEQAFFRRLSVFVGGFTLGWAAAMIRGHGGGEAYPIDAGIDPRLHWHLHVGRDLSDPTGRRLDARPLPALALDPMDGVQALLDSSLLQAVPDGNASYPRYQMLETIREYGADRLRESGEETEVLTNHSTTMLGFAELMREEMWNAPQSTAVSRIEAELGNIRAVLSRATARPTADAELGLRMSQSLWLFWQTRGYVAEGRQWLERAIALAAGPEWDQALARTTLGLLSWIQGDLAQAEAVLAEALTFWQRTGNKTLLGQTRLFRGLVAWTRGDLPRLVSEVRAALELFQAWDGRHGIGVCLIVLAIVADGRDQPDEALRLLEEALVVSESVNFGWASATSRLYAAEIERNRGALARAASLSIDALDRFSTIGDPWGTGAALAGIAQLAATHRDSLLAAQLLGASARLRAHVEAFLPVIRPEAFVAGEDYVRDQLGALRYERTYRDGRDLPPEAALSRARRFARAVATGKVRPVLEDTFVGLTEKQRQVLSQVAVGRTAREIAKTMFLSPRTVEGHRERGLRMLGLTRDEFVSLFGGGGVPHSNGDKSRSDP